MDMAVANLFKHKALFRMDISRGRNDVQSDYRRFFRDYRSKPIENLRSVGVTDINELCLKCLEPFMIYIISQLVVEETEHIDYINVYAGMYEIGPFPIDLDDDGHDICNIYLDNPGLCLHVLSSNSEMTICPIEKRLFDKPFFITVYAYFGFMTPVGREGAVLEWAQYIESRNEIEEEEEDYSSDDEEYGRDYSEITDEEIQEHESTNEQFLEYKIIIVEEYTPPIETYRQDHCVVCLESKPNILYFDCMHIAICDSCDRLKKTNRKNCDVCRTEISKRVKI